MVQPRARAMASSSGPTSRAARTCSCTWRRCVTRISASFSRASMLEARIAPSGEGPDRGRASRSRTTLHGLAAAAAAIARRVQLRQAPAQNIVAPTSSAQTGLGSRVPLTIHSANGNHRFTVEVAGTPEQQERGLMFRKSLAADRGMIFPYDPPQEVAFWMKNTLIPLDIDLHPRRTARSARIAHAEPLDLTPLPSGEPIAAVLEIRGGRAAELGIQRRRQGRAGGI